MTTDDQLARIQAPTEHANPEFERLAAEEEREWQKQLQQENLATLREDREARRNYSRRIFVLVVCWLLGMGLLVACHGFEPIPFRLEGNVLVTLLGTTNGAVLGLFLVVARYLFPSR